MIEIKYECNKYKNNCSLIMYDDYGLPKACPHLMIVPKWRFIYRVRTF